MTTPSTAWDITIARWRHGAGAALSFTFDDGYRDTCQRAREVLAPFGFRATHAVVGGLVGYNLEGRPLASWEELQVVAEGGDEVAVHGLSHRILTSTLWRKGGRALAFLLRGGSGLPLRTRSLQLLQGAVRHGSSGYLNVAEFTEEIYQAKRLLAQQLGRAPTSFSYPGGWYTQQAQELLHQAGYLSARSSDDGYNRLGYLERYALKAQVWRKGTSTRAAAKWVDQALHEGSWLIEMHHLLEPDDSAGYLYTTPVESLRAHVRYVSQHRVWVDTQEAVMGYLLDRQSSHVELASVGERCVSVTVRCATGERFSDQPLTLDVVVPQECWGIRRCDTGERVRVGAHGRVYLDVLPGSDPLLLDLV
jgi:peptidoglycan/xylan/chitin deacetylase (PgdA/CDA1 family)